MIIRDIVNKTVATISSCDQEPIHIPGSVQPHGVLLAIDESGVIRYCSANVAELFQFPPEQLLQRTLEEIHPALAAIVKEQKSGYDKPKLLEAGGKTWLAAVRRTDSLWLVEMEEAARKETQYDLFEHTSNFALMIERSRSLQELCQRIADQTRTITGYDRVMVYRFDASYNGQVFAESKEEHLPPYLNLHYPHTDIPVQARELYLRMPMRTIVDVHYEPVPLLTTGSFQNEQLDLSDVSLRSVSPIHIQYLKNMGVGATLTISLILGGKLWGLIACHHSSKHHPSYEQRQMALLHGQFLTSQIRVREVAEEYEVNMQVEAHLQQLLNVVPQEGDFALKFQNFSSLLRVTNASGVVILHKGVYYEKGITPSKEKVTTLLKWLSRSITGLQFSTSHLLSYYPGAEAMSQSASGILYHKLGDPEKDAIIWFREELERTIHWAGNPHDAVQKNTRNQLTPRSSFAIYREKVQHHSLEWRVSEINAATRFASTLQNQFHLEYLRHEEAHQRLLNEKLQRANQELANINWITTHDLKEPLRKILLFSSKLIDHDEVEFSQHILSSIERIQGSAKRMQALVDDIITYSLSDDKQSKFIPTDLNQVLQDIFDEYSEEIQGKHLQYEMDELPVLFAVPYQMRQLFANLLGNAVKFAQKGGNTQLEIRCTQVTGDQTDEALLVNDKRYYLIEVKDNGIGFTAEQGKRIFDIFYRLHDRQSYPGTGIGLAICKRIVESHGGLISADGQPGQGAEFRIYLPVVMDQTAVSDEAG